MATKEDSDFDVFGDTSSSDSETDTPAIQHRGSSQPTKLSVLDLQRRQYLQSSRKEVAFPTLRNQKPINFGQVFGLAERQAILSSLAELVEQSGWTLQRHGAFPTRDIPVNRLSVANMVTSRLQAFLFPHLEERTGISEQYWTFRDLFIIGYHQDHQRSLEMHSDGSLASLTLLLNETSEFEGGGTFFEKFNMLVKQNPGDAWIHDGRLDHCSEAITRGERIVMVAFIDTVGGCTDLLIRKS
ncbi:hypothetical protein LPJ78_003716 [Coemansia sp. RSA 989]|nr:hypothetical protein BX667DRAFT_502586 [Coemansia mojavensis]KAJ1741413.1 hypothetical protein LPJ68_002854 [Coemansia sp. RSA 1086]KAJ1749733.1 hypothetical protein LPJ79_003470 [Coemansia sp. RSA 1821]KAJ1863918.1 hypothetical protein LPJ78_003716 [Coemansia sp. RSA 989]KAJ1871650.1 hypothetical protein LPJ55_003713 [Coemansia sp. RSA 990]KAJ2650289.1 hypothetical protein IWW40_002466 [Coemansia sp. RSA 1250]KAJ2675667.1 hypothetical protein IWW42_001089 [Coemansia sp. RSA 1085]